MQQIRITKTPEIQKVLSFLKRRYHLLSEAEIVKVVLSEKYEEEDKEFRERYEHLKAEGKKLGDKMMREKGLDPEKVTEEEFYNIFLNEHKHA